MCQALLPKASGDGRVMALEILMPNSAIRNLIREDKIHQIYSMMQTGQDKFGMQTFNQALASLYHKRLITLETAMQRIVKRRRTEGFDRTRFGLKQCLRRTGQTDARTAHGSPYAQGRPVGQRPPVAKIRSYERFKMSKLNKLANLQFSNLSTSRIQSNRS